MKKYNCQKDLINLSNNKGSVDDGAQPGHVNVKQKMEELTAARSDPAGACGAFLFPKSRIAPVWHPAISAK
jgi:hypothetical protein